MKPGDFEYFRPETVEEALALKSAHPDARFLAGGQSLIPLMNMRLAGVSVLVDLNGLEELTKIRVDPGWVEIGAMVTHRRLIREPVIAGSLPVLGEAASYIGHPAIRNRGTLAGSLAHADPSAELGLALVALEGLVRVRHAAGETRFIPAQEFFVGPLMTVLEPGELITAVRFPRFEGSWRFAEVSRRRGDFALASAIVGRVGTEFRIAVGGVEGAPRRLQAVEERLAESLSWTVGDVEASVQNALEPDDGDLHGSGWYRRQVAAHLVARLVEEVARNEA